MTMPLQSHNPHLAAALHYASRGYRVHPLATHGKKPKLPNWPHLATTDEAVIRDWWTEWPRANIGLVCNGLIVIDIDVTTEQPDHEWLQAPWPDGTPIARTPRGGRHVVMRRPSGVDVTNSVNGLADRIDVRTDGGYIVVAPSIATGVAYQWLTPLCHRDELPEPPQWLLDEFARLAEAKAEKATPARPTPLAPTTGEPNTGRPDAIERARQYASRLDPSISGQGGHKAAYRAACAIAVGFNLSDDEAFDALSEWNARCEPPWSEAELRHKIRSAREKAKEQPGYLLDQSRETQASQLGDVDLSGIYRQMRAMPSASDSSRPLGEVGLTCLADVESVPIEWLWASRIAVGKLCLIAGDPGLGKSTMTLDIAARVTIGSGWPDQSAPCPPGDVILLSAEDDLADTVRPRLDAAGADCQRVYAIDTVTMPAIGGQPPTRREFSLASDLPRLEEAIATMTNPKLVIIDPISSYLGDADSHKNAEVRSVLRPLADFAQRHRVAVILVTHLNKGGEGGKSVYRASGSIAFVAACRTGFLVERDPTNKDRALLLPAKNNIAARPKTWAFEAKEGYIHWIEERDHDADDVMMDGGTASKGRRQKDDIKEWMTELLGDGPVAADDVIAQTCSTWRVSGQTVQRYGKEIGVTKRRVRADGDVPAHYLWSMPRDDADMSLIDTEFPAEAAQVGGAKTSEQAG